MATSRPRTSWSSAARTRASAAASDQYAAGVVLYELLTGTAPFGEGSTVEVMIRHLRERPMPPSQRQPEAGIGPALDELVARTLAKEPGDRFADAEELAAALARVRAATATSADATAVRRRPLALTRPGLGAAIARPRAAPSSAPTGSR